MNTLSYLYLTFSVMVLGSGVVILTSSLRSDALLGGKIWATGNFTLFTGLTLLAVRSSLPYFWGGIVGNFLLILAPTFYVVALGKLCGFHIKMNFGVISAVLAVLGVGFFQYVVEIYGMRMISFAIGELAVIIFTLKKVLTQENRSYKKFSTLLVILYCLMGFVLLFRIFFAIINIDRPMEFFEGHYILLTSMVGFIGLLPLNSFAFILVSNGVNYSKVYHLAYHDELTNLFNRRAIIEVGEKYFALSKRTDHLLTVMMIDLDKMKRINDTYGHFAGDLAVISLSAIVQKNLRGEDALGRYGGDEFIAVLPNTKVDEAIKLVERLITKIEEENASQDHPYGPLSASFGLCQNSNDDESFQDLLKKADMALYEAKKKEGPSYYSYLPDDHSPDRNDGKDPSYH